MGVTYSCLEQILRSKKILDDARDGKAIADAILSRMVKELQVAQNTEPLLPPKTNLAVQYTGQPTLTSHEQDASNGRRTTEISFISTSLGQFRPDGGAQSDLVQITYRAEPDPEDTLGERLRLIREETPYITPAKDAYKKSLAFPISHDLVQFEFLFFDSSADAWIDQWGTKANNFKLPPLIQLLFKIRSPLGAIQTYSTIVYVPAWM